MTIYFVWRRSDGHVAATTYPPDDFVGGNGSVTTFEHLGRFHARLRPSRDGGMSRQAVRERYYMSGAKICTV